MNPPDVVFRCIRVLALLVCLLAAQPVKAALLLEGPDLAITKTHQGDFTAGQSSAQYTITVTNTGSVPYTGAVLVVDMLPLGLAYTGVSDPQNAWQCTHYPADRKLECGRSVNLASGASSSFSISASVSPTAPAQLTNTVDLFTAVPDANPANNHAEDTAVVLSGPDLLVKMSTSSLTVRQGQKDVAFTLAVSNEGSGPTTAPVTVTAQLSEGLLAKSMQGSGWLCDLAARTCTRSDPLIKQGSYSNITLMVDVAQDAPLQVTSQVRGTVQGEMNTGNNTASIDLPVQQAADMTIIVQHDADFRQGQADALYRLRVINIGLGPTISPVTVTDLLPEGMQAVSMEGDGWECIVALVSCTYRGAIVPLTSPPEILLRVRVAEDAPPQVTNYADVSGGGEFNTANNRAADPTTIIQLPDLTITKTHVGNFYQGQEGAQYTITVSNVGAGPVFGDVLVQDVQPKYYNWQEITGLSGLGWSCSLIHFNCMREDDTGLPPGKSYPPITVTVRVFRELFVQQVTNGAVVTLDGELNTANNRAEDRAVVVPHVDLAMNLSHERFFSQGQKNAVYSMKVTSEGAYPPSGPVTVRDFLPAGLTARAIRGEDWQCALSTLTCTYTGDPPYDKVYPAITLVVDVAQNAPELVENRARVTTPGDIDASDNEAVDATSIYPAPDLTVALGLEGTLVRGKSGAVFVVTVTNAGGRADAPVTLKAPLAEGLRLVSMAGDGWQCSTSTRSCTRSDLLHSGFSYPPVRIAVETASSAGNSITHTVTVSGGGEWNTTNNTATITVPVYTAPAVTANPQMAPGCLGAEVRFTAKASGVPVPSVQWQVSDDGGLTWTDLSGETGEDLRFPMLIEDIGRSYRAVFRNAHGTAASQPAAVDLHDPLAFVIHPADQSAVLGQPVTYQSEITGHPWQITWRISPDGAAWQAIPGASGKTLTFIPRPLQDGWLVRAEASNACGVVVSRSARLGVPHRSIYLPILSR